MRSGASAATRWRQSQFTAIAGSATGMEGRSAPADRQALVEPGREREHLGGRPGLAARGNLRLVVQATQDSRLAQVCRQDQAPGIEMCQAAMVQFHAATPVLGCELSR